ncbi:MAG: serine/threonine protein kinase [Deltaproteobacteria bacterium]|nr:serine/threonine protein kinase [Deltaproteobacteria bacterium]
MTNRGGDLLDQRYLLVERLGSGGTGEVWRAADHQDRLEVAVKLLHHQHLKTPTVLDRFVREARILTSLQHPNIARAVAYSDTHDPPYMILEFIEGADLSDWLTQRAKAGQKPTVEEIDHLAQCLFDALEYAHGQGVVHRDLKPANVMIQGQGLTALVKIVDFGIAKIIEGEGADSTTAGRTLGTFTYLAPEQLDASGADHRADIFALGTLLFELLTLHRAWLRDMADRPLHCLEAGLRSAPLNAPVEVMRRILTGTRPVVSQTRRELSIHFDEVIGRALTVRRSERFQDIPSMRVAWDRAIVAATPGRIVRRKETAQTPSMKATEVIMTDLPPVMPQTMVIQPGGTSVWTRDAPDKTPKDGTAEIPGAKTNTDPVRVFPGEISDEGISGAGVVDGPTQPPKPSGLPPKSSSQPPRALNAPPASVSNPAANPTPLVMPLGSLSGAQSGSQSGSRRSDFLAGSLVLSITLLIITYLIMARVPESLPVAPLQTAPAPAPEPTVVPAATPKVVEPEPETEPPKTNERPRRRGPSPKSASPAIAEPPAPPPARNPLWADLERLEAHPEDTQGRLNLGDALRAESDNLGREQGAMIQTCVGQSHLAADTKSALAKLRSCLQKLDAYQQR